MGPLRIDTAVKESQVIKFSVFIMLYASDLDFGVLNEAPAKFEISIDCHLEKLQ